MFDDCVYHMKEQNESLNQFIGKKARTITWTRSIQNDSTNTEQHDQYESYRPSFYVLAEFFHILPSLSSVWCGLIWPYRYYINELITNMH